MNALMINEILNILFLLCFKIYIIIGFIVLFMLILYSTITSDIEILINISVIFIMFLILIRIFCLFF